MTGEITDTPNSPEIDPNAAATPAQYVALLRRWQVLSGLSYRQLQRAARSQGEDLPPSTLGTLLSRETLPREPLVTTLLRAGGADDAEVGRWLEAHRRLRLVAVTPPESGPEPAPALEQRPTRRTRWWLFAGVAAAALLVAGAATWVVLSQRRSSPVADPTPGTVSIQPAGSGLCLAERPDRDEGFLFEAPCDAAFPQMTLIRADDGRYGIQTLHPQFGLGCMGYNPYHGQFRPSDGYCAEMQARDLALEAADGGFRIRFTALDRCMAVRDGPHQAGADIVFAECDGKSANQVFTLRRR